MLIRTSVILYNCSSNLNYLHLRPYFHWGHKKWELFVLLECTLLCFEYVIAPKTPVWSLFPSHRAMWILYKDPHCRSYPTMRFNSWSYMNPLLPSVLSVSHLLICHENKGLHLSLPWTESSKPWQTGIMNRVDPFSWSWLTMHFSHSGVKGIIQLTTRKTAW